MFRYGLILLYIGIISVIIGKIFLKMQISKIRNDILNFVLLKQAALIVATWVSKLYFNRSNLGKQATLIVATWVSKLYFSRRNLGKQAIL